MAVRRSVRKYLYPLVGAFVIGNFLSFIIYSSTLHKRHHIPVSSDKEVLGTHLKNVEREVEHPSNILPKQVDSQSPPGSGNTFESPPVRVVNETIDLSNVYPKEDEDQIFPLLDNPWMHSDGEVPIAQYDHSSGDVKGCPYRQFATASVVGKTNFVIHEYIRYKLCQNAREDWLQSNIKPSTGEKGELGMKTNFVYDISPPRVCPSSFSAQTGNLDTLILFIVRSKSDRFSERNSIRTTWGSREQLRPGGHKLVFLVGGQPGEASRLDSKIRDESQLHRDIVRCPASEEEGPSFALEQYVLGLAWAYRECPLARFVAFVSDQTFVNIRKFDTMAKQEQFVSNRIYGSLLRRRKPDRDPNGIHHLAPVEWPWKALPGFLDGPSFVLSGDVVPRMLMAVKYTPVLALDQVYITGLVALAAGIMRIGVKDFFVPQVPTDDDQCSFARHGGIERVASPEDMAHIWQDVKYVLYEKNITCLIKSPCMAELNGMCLLFAPDHKQKRDKAIPLLKH